MKLTVVGCSGSVSGPESASSCYLVQAQDQGRTWSVLLDLGSGAFGQCLRHVDPAEVDAVLISHLHADHIVDLASMHVFLKYGPGSPHAKLRVVGPAGTAERVEQICGDTSTSGSPLAVEAWQPGVPITVGPLVIEPFVVLHPTPAYAMRITGPSETAGGTRVLTYSGDTDSCESVIAAAEGADLFLCEAAFEEGREAVRGVHLSGRRAGEAAQAAGVKSLVLTHLPPWTSAETVRAEAVTAYAGPVDVAAPEASWTL